MNELCFVIEDRELHIDQVLIDYNDEPVFYVCKDNEKYYIVLCTDLEKMRYYIAETEVKSLFKMITGKQPMRDSFLRGNRFWEVLASDSVENDLVRAIKKNEIALSDLPKDGARFEIYSDELREYSEKLGVGNRASVASVAKKEKCSVVEVSFEEGDGHDYEISCTALGEALDSLQKLVYSLAYKEDKTFGQFPRSIREQFELKVSATFAASFGVQLKTNAFDDEMKQRESDEVIEKLDSLIAVSQSTDSLTEVLSNESRRTYVYYNDFLRGLKRNNLGFRINSASPFRKFNSRHMSTKQVTNMIQRIGNDIEKIKKTEQFHGILKGINIEKKQFTFIANVEGESLRIDGSIDGDLLEKKFTVPSNAKVTVETRISFDKRTGKEKCAYKLKDVV